MSTKTRLEDLAADDALFGLDTDEAAELERLSASAPSLVEELELVAARLTLHGARGASEPLPAELRAKIQASAFEHFDGIVVAPPPSATTTGANIVELAPVATRRRRSTTALIFAAAACLVAGVGVSALRSSAEDAGAPSAPARVEPPTPLTATSGETSAELHASSSGLFEVVAFGLRGEDHALYLLVEEAGTSKWVAGPDLVEEAGGARVAKLSPGTRVVGFAIDARGLEPSDGALAAARLRAVRADSPRVRVE